MFDGIIIELWMLIFGVFANLCVSIFNNRQNIKLKKRGYSIQSYVDFTECLNDFLIDLFITKNIDLESNDINIRLKKLKKYAFKTGSKDIIYYLQKIISADYLTNDDLNNKNLLCYISLLSYSQSYVVGGVNTANSFEYISLIVQDKSEINKMEKIYIKYNLCPKSSGIKILNKLLNI